MIEVLQDIVYMIIRPSGEVMEISCNNKYENHKLFSNDSISSAQFYLPVKTTLIQKEILTAYQEEIDKIKCIFLEKYNEETESFYSLY